MSPYGKVSFVSFLLIHYTRRGAALVSDDPGKIFYELSLLQIQNLQTLHMKKRELGLSKKRKQWVCILPSLLLLFPGYKY